MDQIRIAGDHATVSASTPTNVNKPSSIYSEISLNRGAPTLVADALVRTLEDLGIRAAFGIPGGPITSLFNALAQSTLIQTQLCQHETGAAYMALGRTLVSKSKEVVLCFATAGPGITNMITGIAAAFEERVPLFVISGNVATHLKGKYAAQDSFSSGIDAVKMLEPITARSVTAWRPEEVPNLVRDLFNEAVFTRKPVHLNLPSDIANHPWTDQLYEVNSAKRSAPGLARANDSQQATFLSTVSEDFLKSARPLIFAGHGVKTSGHGDLLRQAIDELDLPLIVTSHAKGIVPEDHPYYFGTFGFAATPRAQKFLEAYDPTAIVFLGTRLGEPSSAGWSPILSKPALRIHVDLDPDQQNKIYSSTHFCNLDLSDFLKALLQKTALSLNSPILFQRRLEIMSAHQQSLQSPPAIVPDNLPADPSCLIEALNFWLPDNAIVFSDIGNSMAWIIHHFEFREGHEFYVPLGYGAMGSGVCGAIGAKTVNAHRPVICVVGDAAMLMHGTELFTALQTKIGVKILVLNDGGHGMVDHGNRIIGFDKGDVRFRTPVDFVSFGKALGIEAFRADSLNEFLHLPLDQIFHSAGPSIIDIKIDKSKVPPIRSRARVLGQGDILKGVNNS